MPSYRITRWMLFRWRVVSWLETWAPYASEYDVKKGRRVWNVMTPWAYAALIWDRLIGRRNWPLLKSPERPKRRFLVVPIDFGGPPKGGSVDWRTDGPA